MSASSEMLLKLNEDLPFMKNRIGRGLIRIVFYDSLIFIHVASRVVQLEAKAS